MTQDANAKSAPTLGSLCLVSERITEYLANGGLFNPELMDPEEVRSLLIDARDKIAVLRKGIAERDDLLYRIQMESFAEDG